ncbi:hypothetical protein SPONL_2077 [uncultured Candidatus Thioglobus sp.]|nr:hypothetical protein SPONL_2077 [uncultured Candidatus Thioglobus sp.]
MNLKQEIQEIEYDFPYHYLPQLINNQVVPGQELNWAGEYLLSLLSVERCIKHLKLYNILDIGCGDGRLVNEMSLKFPNSVFTGIDYSERAISLARSMSKSNNSSFKLVDLNKKNNLKDKYDLVTSIEVLEHIPVELAQDFFYSNVSMVRKNGYLLIIVPHKNKKLTAKHEQHFSTKDMLDIVNGCKRKLEIIEFKYFDNSGKIFEFFRRLVKNKIYTLNFIWKLLLNRQITLNDEKEKKCGRMFCLIKCY